MPANVQSMAFYGNVPWHELGKRVPQGVVAEEMIRSAGLDWEVALRAARGARVINHKNEYSRYEVIRMPRANTKESEVLLGVVSRRYQPLQNTDAFAFFDPIVGENKAYFETAGALGEGERIWVMARMPGAMQIAPGDECQKYLLLSNTHTGEGSVTVKFTSIRVVCQNTLMLAMKDGQKAYRVRHSKQMKDRLEDLSDLLALTQEVFLQAEACFQQLARIQMAGDRLQKYFHEVYPPGESLKQKGKTPERWKHWREEFERRPDLQMDGVRGTLWGAYNAITHFEDYRQPQQGEMEDQRLERAWFGSGADIKLKALMTAAELSRLWR